jgi:hypothetical protein
MELLVPVEWRDVDVFDDREMPAWNSPTNRGVMPANCHDIADSGG